MGIKPETWNGKADNGQGVLYEGG